MLTPKKEAPRKYYWRLDENDKVFIERLEKNLFRLGGYNKPFMSEDEKLWIKSNLQKIKEKGFDNYGNFHYIIGKNPKTIYTCLINEKNKGFYTIEKNNFKNIVKAKEKDSKWEPLILAGTTLLYTLIEENLPGHYIFCREKGYKWIKENLIDIFDDKIISIIFMSKEEEIKNDKTLYIPNRQRSAFPIYVIAKHWLENTANVEEAKAWSISDSVYFWQDTIACLGVNPGVENQSINLTKFFTIALNIKRQILIKTY